MITTISKSILVFYCFSLIISSLPVGEGYCIALSRVIRVPEDYQFIQEAIINASPKDFIVVKEGIYEENLVVNKPLSIIGRGAVVKQLRDRDAVQIASRGVRFEGFCVLGSNSFIGCGISVNCYGAYVVNNTVSGFLYGIQLYDSKQIVLRNNVLFGNYLNLKVWGLPIEHFFHDIDSSNLVNGRKVYYLVNVSGYNVPSDAGYLGIVNSSNVIVDGASFSFNAEGILIAYSNSCEVLGNEVFGNERGIRLIASNNITIMDNHIHENDWAGIVLDSSCDNSVFQNDFWGNSVGILTSSSILLGLSSKNNVLAENMLTQNDYAFYLSEVSGNNIARNVMLENDVGLYVRYGEDNVVYGNFLQNNGFGIRVYHSNGNVFYSNSFIGNGIHVEIQDDLVSRNLWNLSYPMGGNYWDNLAGFDLFSGSKQNCDGSDGIIDDFCELSKYNVDFYPLCSLMLFFNAGMWNGETYFVGVGSSSQVEGFAFDARKKCLSFRVREVGNGFCRISVPKHLLWCDYSEDWLLLINDTAYSYRVFENDDYASLYFRYYAGFHFVNGTATHSVLENVFFGDVNHDGEVSFSDLLLVVRAFGSFPGNPRWNAWADLNNDSKVDLRDVCLEIIEIRAH
jgi:parallel beta-helix repeat protein